MPENPAALKTLAEQVSLLAQNVAELASGATDKRTIAERASAVQGVVFRLVQQLR